MRPQAKTAGRRELASFRHPLLQGLRRALERGELTPEGCCAVEGPHLVEEALRSPVEVRALVAARSAQAHLARLEATAIGAPSYLIPDRVFRSISQTETPQGIAALVRLPEWKLEKVLARPRALVAVLVGLQDPGNLGTILRALEAFGGAACLLAENSVSPFNAKAVRASAGSLFRVPVFHEPSAEKIFALCLEHGLRTVGLSPRAAQRLDEVSLREPVAFFVGQEAGGLPREWQRKLDVVGRIPLAAPVESLNAAMAATLAFYEAARQRGLAEKP